MDHTFKAVDEELMGLRRDVAAMGDKAVAQVRAAVDAFVRQDVEAAQRIAAADDELDAMDAEIERRAVRFIALHQPMADDLRAPIAAMKTAMNLERCGDLAKSIAKRVKQFAQPPNPEQTLEVARLGQLVADRLQDVIAAYRDADFRAAMDVWAKDAEVDQVHDKVFSGVLACMATDPSGVEGCTHVLFISKNLERIGNHATNIAELVCYQITGQELSGRPKL
jgi:phosphate transport system protein